MQVRRGLLDAVLNSPSASCLTTGQASVAFNVAGAYRQAVYFYGTERTPARAAAPLAHFPGHWHSTSAAHSTAATRESGAKDSGAKAVCKAYHKLSEAIEAEPAIASSLAVLDDSPLARLPVCIDIGASPGGWTDLLSRHARVVAVDPGDLVPEVLACDRVCHLRMILGEDEASTARLREAMKPCSSACFVVCDANIAPADAAQLVRHLGDAGLLAPGCKIVLTLKLTHSRNRQRQEQEAVEALGSRFAQVRIRHLFANTQHEATLTAAFAV